MESIKMKKKLNLTKKEIWWLTILALPMALFKFSECLPIIICLFKSWSCMTIVLQKIASRYNFEIHVITMKYLHISVFMAFCVYSESAIRIQRDFNYPIVDEFDVYWNVPTFLCHKHGINFEKYTRKFGIIANPGDLFRGDLINILYDPGLFPAMLKDSRGKLLERNGGIPQLGNLTLHLENFRDVVEKVVPQDFHGVGIIDFEAWRPIFRQNWNDQEIYKIMSKELERQHHPQWTEKKISLYASHHFEEASKPFMETTLRLAKFLRPRGTWGYYAFPYCYNYRENKDPHCTETVEEENNRIQWLFDESTALYPSMYMSYKLTEEEHRKFVIGRLNEAWRVASRVSSRKIPLIYPYIGFKYYDSADFLSEGHIYTALETTRKYKTGGAIIWGATENVSSKEKCISLLEYLNTVLGPVVARVKENNRRKLKQPETILGFVNVPFIPQVGTAFVTNISETFYPKTVEVARPTNNFSSKLQNYNAY